MLATPLSSVPVIAYNSRQVEYSWSSRKALVQGGDGGARTEIVFDPGEFITQIEGHASEDAISQLTFVTNKRTSPALPPPPALPCVSHYKG